jgi:hypothetical protein
MRAHSLRLVVLTLVGAVAAIAGAGGRAGAQAPPPYVAARDPAVGTWRLVLQKSKYYPGPAPQTEIRTYEADGDFLKCTIQRVDGKGRAETVVYKANYDNPYPVTGSPDYDAIKMTRIDDHTAESVLSHAGRVFGIARRVLSPGGMTMTITLRREGEVLTNNVAFYEKVSR